MIFTPNYKWKLRQLSQVGKQPFYEDDLRTINPVQQLPKVSFKYTMPLWQRVYMVLMGLLITLVGLAMLGVSGVVLYVFIKILFF